MATLKDAVRAVAGTLGTKQDLMPWKSATLGDGKGTVSTGNNMCYVRLTENSSVIEVLNTRTQPIDGMRVRIGKIPEQPLVWQVLGYDDQRIDENGATSGYGVNYNVGLHGIVHGYLGVDQVNVDWRQITSLRVYAVSGFTIGVLGGIIPRAGADLVVSSQTLDLTSHVPVSGALWCLISIDSAGAIAATDGVTVASVGALTIGGIPDTPAGNFRLAAVRLYAGQTTIEESTLTNDLRDLRWPQERLATAISADQLDIAHYKIVAVSGGDYTDVQSAINALAATGGLVEIMPGAYTSTTISLADGVYIFSGGDVSLISSSGAVFNLPASGGTVVRGVQLTANGGGAAISYPSGSTAVLRLIDSRIVHVSGTYAIDASIAGATAQLTLEHTDIDFNSGGIYSKAITRLIESRIAGNVVQAASAGALTIEAGRIYGGVTVTSTASLIGLPQIDGTITGTPTGAYLNSTGNVTSAQQLISTLATGTSPLSVASTTLNTNLNADMLDGLHSDSFAPAAHDLLSTTHGDTLAAAVARGSVIIGNSTPKWSTLALGGVAGSVLTRNATDVTWSNGAISFSGAYTLTVPATGTAALLGVANTFTTGAQTIQTGADATIGLIVKANSGTQSANLQDWRDSSNNPLAAVTFGGSFASQKNLALGVSSFSGIDTGTSRLSVNKTVTDITGTEYGINSSIAWNPTTNNTQFVYPMFMNVAVSPSANVSLSRTLTMIYALGYLTGTNTTIGGIDGIQAVADARGTATVTAGTGGRFSVQTNAAGAKITTARRVWAERSTYIGTAATTFIGVDIDTVDQGTTNYAIRSSGGQSFHAGNFGLGNGGTAFSASAQLHVVINPATTNSIDEIIRVSRNSSSTPAAGLGSRTLYTLKSSTTTDQSAAAVDVLWSDATHATRAASIKLSTFYTSSERAALTITADSVASQTTIANAQAGTYTTTAVDLTLTTAHHWITVTATGKTITLPAAANCTGREYIITMATTGSVTIDANASETIDGELTQVIYGYETLQIKCNGTGWFAI